MASKRGNSDASLKLELAAGERRYIMGQAMLIVESGRVNVFGCELSPGSAPNRIVSPPSDALIYIENSDNAEKAIISLSSLRDGLESMCFFDGTSVLGLTGNTKQTFLVSPSREGDSLKYMDISKEWERISNDLVNYSCNITLVCGPRKVGKSTLTRYLCNRLLNKFKTVCHIDLDPGQTEFTPPGFGSLTVLQEALLGPPVRHAGEETHMQYFGLFNVSEDPDRYYQTSLRLFRKYKEMYEPLGIPLVVNTIGWVTGLGQQLLQGIVQAFKPSSIVALTEAEYSSAPVGEIPNFIHTALYTQLGLFGHTAQPYSIEEPIYVAVSNTPSMPSEESGRHRIHPGARRDLMWKSYFCRQVHDIDTNQREQRYNFEKPLTFMSPYSIHWSEVCLQLTIPKKAYDHISSVLPSLNGAVAGIATYSQAKDLELDPKADLNEANIQGLRIKWADSEPEAGFEIIAAAIIRSVDPTNQTLDILSPFPLHRLQTSKAHTLVVNPRLRLSDKVYLHSSQGFTDAPYISAISTYSGSQTTHTRKTADDYAAAQAICSH